LRANNELQLRMPPAGELLQPSHISSCMFAKESRK
jgi:hypothetical protein